MKVQRILINIIIVLLVIIFLMCGYLVIDYFRESNTQQEQFNNLASLVEQAQNPPSLPVENETTLLPTFPMKQLRPLRLKELNQAEFYRNMHSFMN